MLGRLLVAAALAATAFTVGAQETYTIDPVHSQPRWEVRHLGFSSQQGNFGKATGTVVLDRAAKKAAMNITIDATSLKSWDSRVDAILKGDRFFNIEKFPTITFRSTNVTFDGDSIATIQGELTIVGITKPVALKVTNFACGLSPQDKRPMCGADATTTIKRTDWGMNAALAVTSDEVRLFITVEAYREQG